MFNEKIKWNFTKFLVDRQGHVVKRFSPQKKLHNYHEAIEALYNTKGIQFVLASWMLLQTTNDIILMCYRLCL